MIISLFLGVELKIVSDAFNQGNSHLTASAVAFSVAEGALDWFIRVNFIEFLETSFAKSSIAALLSFLVSIVDEKGEDMLSICSCEVV
jgi:hypothetical protein